MSDPEEVGFECNDPMSLLLSMVLSNAATLETVLAMNTEILARLTEETVDETGQRYDQLHDEIHEKLVRRMQEDARLINEGSDPDT